MHTYVYLYPVCLSHWRYKIPPIHQRSANMTTSYYTYIKNPVLALLIAPFLQLVAASASAQYHLSVDSDISSTSSHSLSA